MHEKTIRFDINSQNKQLIELQLESMDVQNIRWEHTKIEIIIDMGYFAFSNIDNLNSALFYWIKLGAINVSIIINNVADDSSSNLANVNFFNSVINKLESCNLIQYLKIIVLQPNIFNAADFSGLVRMFNLKELDLSGLTIQEDEINDYLIPITNFLNSIEETSKISKILLPSNLKKQSLNVECGFENQLFNSIKHALSVSISLIEISPLPIFIDLQDDIQAIMNKKQGVHLEELYHEHDKDYETIRQLKSIPNPTYEVAALLANKIHKFNNAFKDVEVLSQIIDCMKPKNIYWLDKILREKLNNPIHILCSLRTVNLYDDCREILFKMLQGLVSDLMACRFKEIDLNCKILTNFVCVDDGLTNKEMIVRTLFKIHLEFDLSQDDYLSKILSNMIEEFVYGFGGMKPPNDRSRLAPGDKLDDCVLLFMNVLKKLESLHLDQQKNNILQNETGRREAIYREQLEEQTDLLLFAFNYYRAINNRFRGHGLYGFVAQSPRYTQMQV